MQIATLLFFIIGFGIDGWSYSWIVFPVGGIMCAIISEIIKLVNNEY